MTDFSPTQLWLLMAAVAYGVTTMLAERPAKLAILVAFGVVGFLLGALPGLVVGLLFGWFFGWF